MSFYKLLNKYKHQLISITIIIAFLCFANRLLFANVVYESDDYKLHAVRIANYYLALKQGQLPVRWGPNLNGSYGYPSFNYMYHTPYLAGTILHVAGFSIQQSLNLAVLFAILCGSVAMYFFLQEYSKSEKWNIVLSLFFILNPYTLLNIYWRGAIGELYFYAGIPLFFLAIKKILEQKNSFFYKSLLAVITAFLVLSHLPSLLLLAPLTLVFIYWDQKNFSIQKLLPIFFWVFIGILLSAWYWIPAYFEQWMVMYKTSGSLAQYATQLVPFFSVFTVLKTSNSSDLFLPVLQIGFVSFFSLFVAGYLFTFSKKVLIWFTTVFVALFLLSTLSKPLWDVSTLLQYIQFPWRFLWIISISSIFIYVQFILEKSINNTIKNLLFAIVAVATLITTATYITSKGTTSRSDFDWYHPTFETGSSFNEHLPIWAKTSYYFPEELLYVPATESAQLNSENLQDLVHPLSELNPTVQQLDGTHIIYTVYPDEDIVVLHKRLFFPGWEAQLEGENTEILTNIPEYEGISAILVPNEETNIKLVFTGYTKLRRFSELLSVSAVLFVIGHLVLKKYRMKK